MQKINASKLIFQKHLEIFILEIEVLCTERNVCKRNENRQIQDMRCKAKQN